MSVTTALSTTALKFIMRLVVMWMALLSVTVCLDLIDMKTFVKVK